MSQAKIVRNSYQNSFGHNGNNHNFNNFKSSQSTQRSLNNFGNIPSHKTRSNTNRNNFNNNTPSPSPGRPNTFNRLHRMSLNRTNPNRLQNGNKVNSFHALQTEENRSRLRGNFGKMRPNENPIKDLRSKPKIKHTDTDDRKQSSKPRTNLFPKHGYGLTEDVEVDEELQVQTLRNLADCKDNTELIRMKEYELLYNIPLLSYIWDIMGLVRVSNKIKGQNVELLLPLLPCKFGIFPNLWRHYRSEKESHWLSPNFSTIPELKQKMLTIARQKYATDCPQIPLPDQIHVKVDGIWETDVKIIRAFNNYLYRSWVDNDTESELENIYIGPECEYHLRIWSNGLVKVCDNEEDEDKKNDSDSIYDYDDEDDDDDEDDLDEYPSYTENKTIEDDQFYADIMKNCGDVRIEEVIKQNKHLKIRKIKRRRNKRKDIDDEKKPKMVENDIHEVDDIDIDYESIDDFVERVCTKTAQPEQGQAIMILIDTRNDPDIIVYIWRREINEYIEDNVKIGDNHINYRKRKYFELKYNGKRVNVGQYIGLSTCILGHSIHQFWSLFDTEIRFEPTHALELWPDFYHNQTLFEVKAPFHTEEDMEKQQRYKKHYGETFINKLNDKQTKFEKDELDEKEEEMKKMMPELKDLPLFLERTNSDDNDNDDDSPPPDLHDYKPFVYHKTNTRFVWNIKQDLGKQRNPIRDLSPKQFQQVKSHAMAQKWSDIKKDDTKHDRKYQDEVNGNQDMMDDID